ncbi:ribosomal protein S18-alanine N-acetyltransferase [Ectobacillus polymachus]|uniref:ribosomal protein S18-alanine N-acetyltransferase n=1 Tax=Ectobacillus polymachus TaxID=1508806 RepID=UPI003A89B960
MNTLITFRDMQLEDIESVLEIEHASFTIPWTEDAFIRELTMNEYANYTVLEENGQVVGYCGMWLILDEASITNIAILPAYRGRQLGEALLRFVMEYARQKGGKTMSLEVRVSNIIAQGLYRKLGFLNGGIRKGYYTDNYEDALVMWVNL